MAIKIRKFSDKKVVATVMIPLPLTELDIESLLVSAIEGGSNYWMSPADMDCPKDMALSQWVTKRLLEGKSHTIIDHETDKKHRLTLKKFLNGVVLNQQKRPFDSKKDDWGGITADCILQFALFGETLYS